MGYAFILVHATYALPSLGLSSSFSTYRSGCLLCLVGYRLCSPGWSSFGRSGEVNTCSMLGVVQTSMVGWSFGGTSLC
jgi:hypothetical protein